MLSLESEQVKINLPVAIKVEDLKFISGFSAVG